MFENVAGQRPPGEGGGSNLIAAVAGALLVVAAIVAIWYFSSRTKKPEPVPSPQSQAAPTQEPQIAASARDILVLALRDRWTPNGFIVEFRYSQPAEGPMMLLGVTLVAQSGERKAVASDKNWFDRFVQAMGSGQNPAPRRQPPRTAIA